MSKLPLGEALDHTAQTGPPACRPYHGRFVSLLPVAPVADSDDLFDVSHGSREKEDLWTYLPYGPYADRSGLADRLRACRASSDPLYLTVHSLELGHRVGMLSFLNILPAHRAAELGHIWYGPIAQRTRVNTESIYLMLCECFDHLHYRRIEWKCDALNERSRAAALRLGFSFEGIFRQHRIVKGRNRDSAWFALLDGDWPIAKSNMEQCLYSGQPGLSLGALNAPLVRATGW